MPLSDLRRIPDQAGHPPRQTESTMSGKPRGDSGAEALSDASSPARETHPLDSPLSKRLIGRIRTPDDTARARVPGDVVGRVGRAGQDELALAPPVVASASHGIPNIRSELPLVEQSGNRPVQHPIGAICAANRFSKTASKGTSLQEWRLPVHVLPQARGPSSTTAGEAHSARWTSRSATRGMYPDGVSRPVITSITFEYRPPTSAIAVLRTRRSRFCGLAGRGFADSPVAVLCRQCPPERSAGFRDSQPTGFVVGRAVCVLFGSFLLEIAVR